MSSSPRLAITYVTPGQAAGEVTLNGFINIIDGMLSVGVQSRTNTPPGSPSNGQTWLVIATASGAWTGKENYIALWYDGWIFIAPRKGFLLWDGDKLCYLRHDGTAWNPLINNIPALTGSPTLTDLKNFCNDLLTKLKASGIMVPD